MPRASCYSSSLLLSEGCWRWQWSLGITCSSVGTAALQVKVPGRSQKTCSAFDKAIGNTNALPLHTLYRCAIAAAHANEVAVFSLVGSYSDEGHGVVLGRGPAHSGHSTRPESSHQDTRINGAGARHQARGGQSSHQSPTLLGASLAGADTITCLLWVPLSSDTSQHPSRSMGSTSQQYRSPDRVRRQGHAHVPSDEADSAFHSVQRCPGCGGSGVLLVGTSAGYLQVHDPWGQVMLRQRLHAHGGAVKHMQLTRLTTQQGTHGGWVWCTW
jgi:hypothetical protein